MNKILLVEDDNTLGMTLEVSLKSQGHELIWCQTLAEAFRALEQHQPDLVLLDLGLPDGDGMELCTRLREGGSIAPILILTARDSLFARVEGLTAGADDYVSKPFELPELLARVEALLRRQRWHGPGERVGIGRLEVDLRRHIAQVDGEPVALTELELRLVGYLVQNINKVVTREELLGRVWEQSVSTRTRTVDVFIGRLRRYIEVDSSNPVHLLNVRGVGYRLVGPLNEPAPLNAR